jgi:2-polyprenyl-6-methoxyphenol hydroxylase-like FAD-dependent oxidoreductase
MHPAHQTSLQSGRTHDVIIVGARAAGAATAMLLARRSIRTLLLDHGPPGADTLSTHALLRGGVYQLTRWGLLEEITAAGTPPIRRTTVRHGGEVVTITMKAAHGVDSLYAPRRTLLDPLLVGAAVEAGAEVHHRTCVTDLIKIGGRVAGVTALTPDGRDVDLGAAVVIGADGVRSTVARLAGAPFTRLGRNAGAATYGYWSELSTDGYEWNFSPDACSGVIPTNDGQACVVAAASPARIGRGGVAHLVELVAEGAPDLAARMAQRHVRPPRSTRTWTGGPGYLRRAQGPGWALVGDAGHFSDPISPQGLTDALRDADLLATAVVNGLRSGSTRDLDGALAAYESTRDCLSLPLFDVVDRIAGQRWDDREIGELLARFSSAVAAEVEATAALLPEVA